uniref:hypothetical protein n=1 Tax=Amycolatopsis sp. CA-293810 TaxID=3239926 RepID=UPI003F491408
MTIATTPSGQPIVCDGCGAPIEVVTAAMRHPVPREIAQAVYGKDNHDGDLVYIVCAPLPGGTQPCLDLALLADELYERVRCRVPGCDGTQCSLPGSGKAGRS